MGMFVLGLGLFAVSHGVLVAPSLAGGLRARLGEGGRKLFVTALAAIGLVLVVLGWGDAASLGAAWTPPIWTRHITLALMLPALILLAAAYLPAGWIKRVAKHPMLAGVKVWAFAHLASNGDVRSLALFGVFLAYAVVARIALKRRGDVGAAAATPALTGDVLAVAFGAAAYAAVAFWLHPILFGVPALLPR